MTKELMHYGVPGMKKGRRKYQNADGSLTRAGEIRYLEGDGKSVSVSKATVLKDPATRNSKAEYHSQHQRTFKKLGKVTGDTKVSEVANPQQESSGKSSKSSKKASTKTAQPQVQVTEEPQEQTKEPVTAVKAQKQRVLNPQADVRVRKEKELGGVGASMMAQPTVNGQTATNETQSNESLMAQQQASLMENALNTANSYNTAHPNGPFMVLGQDGSVSYTKDKKVAAQAASTFESTTLANQRKVVASFKHSDDELEHHGILGQKWGRRRYQNPDGSLTAEGRKHYGVGAAIRSLGEKSRTRRQARLEIKRHTLEKKVAAKKEADAEEEAIRKLKLQLKGKKVKKVEKAEAKAEEKEVKKRSHSNSDDYEKYLELKRRDPRTLSNDELAFLNNRMNAENSRRNSSRQSISNGKEFIRSLANKAVTDLVTKGVDKITSKVVDNAVDRSFLDSSLNAEKYKKQRRIELGLDKPPEPPKKDDGKDKTDDSKDKDKNDTPKQTPASNSGSDKSTSESAKESKDESKSNDSSSKTSSSSDTTSNPYSNKDRVSYKTSTTTSSANKEKTYAEKVNEARRNFINNYRKAEQEREQREKFKQVQRQQIEKYYDFTVSEFLGRK